MSPESSANLSLRRSVPHARSSAGRLSPDKPRDGALFRRGIAFLLRLQRRQGYLVGVALVLALGLAAWPRAARAEAGPFRVYTVQAGDTLSEIAANVGMTTEQLIELNRLAEPDRLIVGTVLVVVGGLAEGVTLSRSAAPAAEPAAAPATETYEVKADDTLSAIASRFDTDVSTLTRMNALANEHQIRIGLALEVPRPAAPPPLALALPGHGTPAAEPPPAPPTETYRVQIDDTLSAIAARFGTDVATLARMNALADEHQIRVGLALEVPRAARPAAASSPLQEHVVQSGETVTGIAARFGVSDAALASANELRDLNRIRVGSVLKIPARVLPLPSPQVAETVREVALDLGLDPYLLLALSYLESGWQMDVVSSTGAVGMMQLMPETAVWASRDLLGRTLLWQNSLRDNTHLGSAYLRHLLVLARGDVATALAAYYQGWTSVQTEGRFEETEQYVDDVLALVDRFRARIPGGR